MSLSIINIADNHLYLLTFEKYTSILYYALIVKHLQLATLDIIYILLEMLSNQ